MRKLYVNLKNGDELVFFDVTILRFDGAGLCITFLAFDNTIRLRVIPFDTISTFDAFYEGDREGE